MHIKLLDDEHLRQKCLNDQNPKAWYLIVIYGGTMQWKLAYTSLMGL